MRWVTLMLLLGPFYASAQEFSRADWERQAAYTALHVIDWRQTQDIARHPGLYETNPLLGRHPSKARVNNYFAATLAGHWAVTRLLPGGTRAYWQYGTIGLEAAVTTHNAAIGLRVTF